MFSKLLRLLFILLTFCAANQALAQQQDTLASYRFVLKISPQHLFLSGYHLSFEAKLPNAPFQSIVVAPHYYKGNTRFADNWSDRYHDETYNPEVTGYGAELQHRFYSKKKKEADAPVPYVGYSASFSAFNMKFEKYHWVEQPEPDGLRYYRYNPVPFTEKINRFGGAALVGMQGPFLSERLLADLYIGLGYTYSQSKTAYTEPYYNKSVFDYGYRGLRPLVGMHFGYAF